METNEIKTLKELRELSGRSFKTLRPKKQKKGLYTIELSVEGYLDLLFTVANLIKVSILALDSDETCSNQVQNPPTNITNILEIALQLLPYDEAEFLDQSRELLLMENENDIPET
jgi:hypothetical protein